MHGVMTFGHPTSMGLHIGLIESRSDFVACQQQRPRPACAFSQSD